MVHHITWYATHTNVISFSLDTTSAHRKKEAEKFTEFKYYNEQEQEHAQKRHGANKMELTFLYNETQ